MMTTAYSAMKVSIVTPSFNQGKFIERTIRSVICQDYPNLEYIVVDAVSQDETQSLLTAYQAHIDLAIVEKDEGQADAINKGLQRCSGEILAYINSDDCYADAQVVSRIVEYFQAHPEVDVVYGRRRFIDEAGYYELAYPYRPFSEPDLYLSCYIPQECVFWRRSIFEKAGGYIDASFSFAMDYEFWLRLLKHGARFVALNDYVGLYRYYPGQKSTQIWKERGLPEIVKLHQEYLGRPISELDMVSYYYQYYHGTHPLLTPESFHFCHHTWYGLVNRQKQLARYTPLDHWVFTAPVRPFRIQSADLPMGCNGFNV